MPECRSVEYAMDSATDSQYGFWLCRSVNEPEYFTPGWVLSIKEKDMVDERVEKRYLEERKDEARIRCKLENHNLKFCASVLTELDRALFRMRAACPMNLQYVDLDGSAVAV